MSSLELITPTLAIAAWQLGLLTVFFIFVCVVMILTVLIQRPQGGGLSGAFGSGAGSGQTAFGARTGDALTWATIIMFAIFIITAVGLNFAARPAPAAIPATGIAGPDSGAEGAESESDDSESASTESGEGADSSDSTSDADSSSAEAADADPADTDPVTPETNEDPAPSGDGE